MPVWFARRLVISWNQVALSGRRDPGHPRGPGPPVRHRGGDQVHRGFGFVLGRKVLDRRKAERLGFSSGYLRRYAGGICALEVEIATEEPEDPFVPLEVIAPVPHEGDGISRPLLPAR